MTTVVDPVGTPTIIYNRSGTTIVSLTGGFSSVGVPPVGNDGVDIPHFSQTTILLATADIVHDGGGVNVSGYNAVFRLPSAEIGDVVEAYLVDGGAGPAIFPQIGERIFTIGTPHGAVSTGTNVSAVSDIGPTASGCRYRKISSDTWLVIGS